VEWHAHFHTIARVCQYELNALTPAHMAQIAGIRRRYAGVVRTALARGVATGAFDISVEDVDRTVRAILSLGIDLVRWYRHDRAETPEELGIFYADLTLQMLGTPLNPLIDHADSPGARAGTSKGGRA
jgi:tetracycline repressor-like protein